MVHYSVFALLLLSSIHKTVAQAPVPFFQGFPSPVLTPGVEVQDSYYQTARTGYSFYTTTENQCEAAPVGTVTPGSPVPGESDPPVAVCTPDQICIIVQKGLDGSAFGTQDRRTASCFTCQDAACSAAMLMPADSGFQGSSTATYCNLVSNGRNPYLYRTDATCGCSPTAVITAAGGIGAPAIANGVLACTDTQAHTFSASSATFYAICNAGFTPSQDQQSCVADLTPSQRARRQRRRKVVEQFDQVY